MNNIIAYLGFNIILSIFLVILVLGGEIFLVFRFVKRNKSATKKGPSVKVFNPQILLVSMPKDGDKSKSVSENPLGQDPNQQK